MFVVVKRAITLSPTLTLENVPPVEIYFWTTLGNIGFKLVEILSPLKVLIVLLPARVPSVFKNRCNLSVSKKLTALASIAPAAVESYIVRSSSSAGLFILTSAVNVASDLDIATENSPNSRFLSPAKESLALLNSLASPIISAIGRDRASTLEDVIDWLLLGCP